MNDKLFNRLLTGITLAGCISTIALLIYTFILHQDCSIVSFVANGR